MIAAFLADENRRVNGQRIEVSGGMNLLTVLSPALSRACIQSFTKGAFGNASLAAWLKFEIATLMFGVVALRSKRMFRIVRA